MKKSQGFTLIELMVVISIIALLASIVLASLSQARAKASVSAGLEFADNNYHALGDQAVFLLFNNNCSLADSLGGSLQLSIDAGGTSVCVNDVPQGTGQSFSFNGSNHMTGTTPSGPNMSSQTVSVWVKLSAAPSGLEGLFWATGSNCPGYYSSGGQTDCSMLTLYTNGWLFYGPSINAGSWHNATGITIPLNTWTNITYTFGPCPTGSNDCGYLYINGVKKDSYTNAPNGAVTASLSSMTNVQVGQFASANVYRNGYMSGLAVYAEALSVSEVEQLYALEAPEYGLAVK